MTQATICVMSVDDHPLLRQGLAAIINHEPDMTLVAEAECGADAIRLHGEHSPDVTLMDLRLPDMSGIDALIAIRGTTPSARIVMLTTFEGDVEIHRALKAGARGYLLKSTPPAELVRTIRLVHEGRKRIPADIAAQIAEYVSEDELTPREIDVLRLVAEGNGNKDVAARLFISEETVKAHLKHIMEKLDARDRTEAVTIALRRGFIQL